MGLMHEPAKLIIDGLLTEMPSALTIAALSAFFRLCTRRRDRCCGATSKRGAPPAHTDDQSAQTPPSFES